MAAQHARRLALAGGVISPLLRGVTPAFQQQSTCSGLRLLASASQSRDDGRHHGSFGNAFGAVAFMTVASASVYSFNASKNVLAEAAKGEQKIQVVEDEYARPASLKGLPEEIVLYQYEVCPFCCKVKSVLDFYKLPYKVVEVNPLTKGELKWSSYKKVPVVKLGDEVVVGSSAIVSRLAAEVEAAGSSSSSSAATGSSTLAPKESPAASTSSKGSWFGMPAPAKPASAPAQLAATTAGVSREEETRWRKWVDERFVKILTANIYRSWDESFDTFRYITEQTNWSWGTREVARMSGAVLMWQVGKRLPKKYNIEGDLREALYKACDEFVDAVGPDRPFLGGSNPNLADLAVYGVMKAVERTPTFKDAMQHSRVGAWFGRMTEAIGAPSRVSTEGTTWGLAPAVEAVKSVPPP